MAAPLLKTKLYLPPVPPELTRRPRLVERLEAGARRRLTLISAPAGFGKTTLLAEWAAGQPAPGRVAWLSLDKGDNDPARFWSYCLASLQTVEGALGATALAMLRSPRPPVFEAVLTELINQIVAIPRHLVLVLDDYHVIEAPAIHDDLSFLLDHLPPIVCSEGRARGLHLVIATRADPPLPLARLRGRGQLTELRQADLAFGSAEVAAFLSGVPGLELPADQIAALTARTEGWIAGLQLAAVSLRNRGDSAAFIQALTGRHEYIADYLSDEVLSQQPEAVRTFLLQTCILDRMTGRLCDAVTGRDGGQRTLEALRAANLFVVPLDDERRWYRYHQLFASLLLRRLQGSEPDSVPELHRRAAGWFEGAGLVFDAVAHALRAGDLERVEGLVSRQVLTMIYQGELVTLRGWLEAIPRQALRARPWLCVAYAWVLGFSGQLDAIEPVLEEAQAGLDEVDESREREHIAGHLAAVRAYVAMGRRDVVQVTLFTRQALRLLPQEALVERSLTTAVGGVALRMKGELEAAGQAMAKAVKMARAAGALFLAADVGCDLTRLRMWQGKLRQAAESCQEALQLAGGPGGRAGPLPIRGYVLAHLSLVLHERNHLEAALQHAREAVDICRRWGQRGYLGLAYIALARTLQSMGDAEGALDAIQGAAEVAADLPPMVVDLVKAVEIQIRLAQGDTAAAWRWAQASGLRVDDEIPFHRYQEYRALAQALIAQGEHEEALVLLGRLLELAEATGAAECAIMALILRAMVMREEGRIDGALLALGKALALGEPEDYVRTFLDQGRPMQELLTKMLERRGEGFSADYVGRLLGALTAETGDEGLETESSLLRPGSEPAERLVEPLSERELEVLRLLTTHLSRQEIADELCISVNTVRFHLKSIYSKLDVHSRSDAIQRAAELGLL
jgi:LuxR family maltose regulon positive regulatory protein